MTASDAIEKAAEAAIQKEMRRYARAFSVFQPIKLSKTVCAASAHKLNKFAIIAAVRLMVIFLGMAGGSIGDIDLYKLNIRYLMDLVAREQMNKLIKEREAAETEAARQRMTA